MNLPYRNRARQWAFLLLALGVGLGGWAGLLALQPRLSAHGPVVAWVVFVLLTLLIKGLGSRVVPRETHSLVGILDLAAILLFGPIGGAVIAGLGSLLYQVERGILEGWHARRQGRETGRLTLIGNVLFDSGLKVGVTLAAYGLYALAGGQSPLALPLQPAGLAPVAILFAAWFVLDHLGWAVAEVVLGGWEGLREWFPAVIGPSLLMELLPLPLSILVAQAYQQDLVAFALLVGGLIGTSLVVQRLFAIAQEERRLVRELASLNEAARAIVQAEMNVEGLCELIYQEAGRVVDTSTFHLGLVAADHLTLHVRVVEGERQDPLTVPLAPGEGIVGWMWQSRQPLLVRDFDREMERLPAKPRYISEHPPRSAIFVPLIARGEFIGSLSIQNARPAAFNEQHLRILSFIANLAAVAIEKARLYEAIRERAGELERIAEENAALYAQVRQERDRLKILYDVSRDLTRRLDLDDLLRRLLQRTVESLNAEDGTILLLGSRREPARAIDSQGQRHTDTQSLLNDGLAGWVVENRQLAVLDNVDEDPRWLPTDRPVGAAIVVPILHGDNVWGVITLTHPEVGFFGQADPTLLLAMSEQAAVALEASRLYEAQRRRAIQLQTIAQVMRSILSILDIDPLLQEVVQLLRDRFGYAHVHVFTLDESSAELVFRTSTDPENIFWQNRGGRISLDEGMVGWVARHGEPAIAGDVSQDNRWLPDQPDVRSEVAVPLKVGEQIIGVLDVQSEETEAFDDEDLFILRTLGNQIAVALESARLYSTQQEEAWVLNALLQAAQNISQARDLEELLEVVVRLVPLLVGVERCIIFLHHRENGVFRALHGYGIDRQALQEMAFPPGDVPALDRAKEQGRTVMLMGEEERQALPTSLREQVGSGSMWLFPLLAGGEISGMLMLIFDQPTAILSNRQHTILSGITSQAGIAIEEARLRRDEVERQRLDQELAVAREIQRSLLPSHPPAVPGWSLDVAWQAARRVGGDFYDFIQLPDNRLGVVIADVSDKGVPAALFMVLARSLVRASALSHLAPGRALERANELIVQDNRAEMFVTVFYGVIDLDTGEMRYVSAGHNPPLLCPAGQSDVFPLEGRGIVLGVLDEIHLEEKSVSLGCGDLLVLYTDGITEAINEDEEEFGEERLKEAIVRHQGKGMEEIRRGILEELEEFSAGQPPFDDLTMVLVRREP